jgi:hypothetical protein
LLFPRISRNDLLRSEFCEALLSKQNLALNLDNVQTALAAEKALGYMVSSGKYWHHLQDLNAAKLKQIDDLWLQAMRLN